MMMDFFNNNARDPIQFVNHSNSYIEFLNMVEDDFQLICFDIVSEPSTPNAYIYPDNRSSTSPSLYETKVNKAKEVIINDLFSKILKD